MERRELSAADIYCKFAAQLDEDGFRLYHAAQRITGFQPYDAFPYEDNRGAFEAADGHTLLRYLEAAHFGAVTWKIVHLRRGDPRQGGYHHAGIQGVP